MYGKLLICFYKYKRKVCETILSKSLFTKAKELRVLFFGTDSFSMPSLKSIYQEKETIQSLAIVTSFKSPSNQVKLFGIENDIKLFEWPVSHDVTRHYDIGIVVSFGYLIPEKIISSFSFGMINLHASLLPRWRGAAPIIYAIMNGDNITGVSIIKIKPKHFDIGEILAQKKIEIKSNTLMPELHNTLAVEGARLMINLIKKIPESLQEYKIQDESLATYAPKISANLSKICWKTKSAKQVYDLNRALFTFMHLTTIWHQKTVKIIDLFYNNEQESCINTHKKPPGYVEYSKKRKTLWIYCSDGEFVEVKTVKVEGKKQMTATDFNNGYIKKISSDKHFFT